MVHIKFIEKGIFSRVEDAHPDTPVPGLGTTPRTSQPCNLHLTPYTLHPTPYTLHLTPYTLHHTPNTLLPPSLAHCEPLFVLPLAEIRRRVVHIEAMKTTICLPSECGRKNPQFRPPVPVLALHRGDDFRGTSLTRKRIPLGPYRRPMSRVLGGS